MTLSDQALWLELTYLSEGGLTPPFAALRSALLSEAHDRFGAEAVRRVSDHVSARSATMPDLRRTILEDWDTFSTLFTPAEPAEATK